MTLHDRRLALPALALVILFAAAPLHASWVVNGNPVCTPTGNQEQPVMTPFLGGAVIGWGDLRSGNNDIYVQYMTSTGSPAWTPDGVALCTDPASQTKVQIAYLGFGGLRQWYFAAVWEDDRNGYGNKDIYAQVFNNSGAPLFAANGAQISTGTTDDTFPQLAGSGNGRDYIVWTKAVGSQSDIYAQQIIVGNSAVWGAGGIPICNLTSIQGGPVVAADANGAIIAWLDYRNANGGDIFAQRVDINGVAQWTANGVPVCTQTAAQLTPQIVSDGAGGAVIMWLDRRNNASETDIYAQRIDASGNTMWSSTGVPVVVGAGVEQTARMISDGASGAYIVWSDPRGPQQPDIYAQRMLSTGAPSWTVNGIPVCTANWPQNFPDLASDWNGGVVISWQDLRQQSASDVYAQHLDGAGTRYWALDGIPVCNQMNPQSYPRIIADAHGGSIVAWGDQRNGASNADIYAVRIENELGYVGFPNPVITSVADVPADQGGHVMVNWTPGDGTFTYFDVYRALLPGAAAITGEAAEHVLDGKDLKTLAGCSNGYLWQHMGTVSFSGAPSYSLDVPTPSDSTGSDPAINYFLVVAVNGGAGSFNSCPLQGYSVDNLAPPAPTLSAVRNGGPVDLSFSTSASDLAEYEVYRSTSPGVTLTPGNYIGYTGGTTFQDVGAPAGAVYYVVTATDIHGNVSDPSDEAGVDVPTGVNGTPRLTALIVAGNMPNPFTSGTVLRVGSPSNRDGSLEVYDVAGRRVRTARLALSEGWQDVRFDGRDDTGAALASGVYFYRVSSAGQARSGKMVIQR